MRGEATTAAGCCECVRARSGSISRVGASTAEEMIGIGIGTGIGIGIEIEIEIGTGIGIGIHELSPQCGDNSCRRKG